MRFLSVLALTMSCSTAFAQEPAMPTEMEILHSLYIAVAMVDFCDLHVDPELGVKAARAGMGLEKSLGLDRAMSEAAFRGVKAAFLANPPDCTPGSSDVTAVTKTLGVH